MNTNFLSTKDYFNYYFSGIVWLVIAALSAVQKNADIHPILGITEHIPTFLQITLLLIIPYIVGFVLSPVGNIVSLFLRKICEDPTNWVLVLNKDNFPMNERFCKKKRISEPSRTKILEKISSLQDGEETKYSPFFWVRNYVLMKENQTTLSFVNRPLDLANLTESLIIPVPILVFLVGGMFLHVCFSMLLSFLIFIILSWRYFKLREYWVKHNYRTFLISK